MDKEHYIKLLCELEPPTTKMISLIDFMINTILPDSQFEDVVEGVVVDIQKHINRGEVVETINNICKMYSDQNNLSDYTNYLFDGLKFFSALAWERDKKYSFKSFFTAALGWCVCWSK